MKNTLYEKSVPVFVYYLQALLVLIEKAEKFAKKQKWDDAKVMEAKLASDQYNFVKQVQYVYFMAFEAAGHVGATDYPKFAYDEKTLRDLKASIKKAILFLRDKKLDKRADPKKKVPTYLLPEGKKAELGHYLDYLALPNFFFHYTTAYDILRHLGVLIGKDDFLGLKKLKK